MDTPRQRIQLRRVALPFYYTYDMAYRRYMHAWHGLPTVCPFPFRISITLPYMTLPYFHTT